MTHLFVAPHPDDVALSCGGLMAGLRQQGEELAILTVFSGSGPTGELTPYQREALGFGEPSSAALHGAGPGAARPDGPGEPGGTGTAAADAPGVAAALMEIRRREDQRFADFIGASIAWLDLPDAVFRGYEGDEELTSEPRPDDPPPVELLASEVARLEPQRVYLPLAIGGHVDHRLLRDAGIALLAQQSIPAGRGAAGAVLFYEDMPYAWRVGFSCLEDLPAGALAGLPADVNLAPEFASITAAIERKIEGVALYGSQLDRQLSGRLEMEEAIRSYGRTVAALGGLPGFAERYWVEGRW